MAEGCDKRQETTYKRPRFKGEEHAVKKRLPPRGDKASNEFYVTNKSDFKGQLAQCVKLLEKGEAEIVVHGLGAAVPRALNLALTLQHRFLDTHVLDVRTSTLDLVDDLEALTDCAEPGTYSRSNSALHVRLYKEDPLPPPPTPV